MAKWPYAGAGILFIGDPTGDASPHCLLGCRSRSGIWSIPGGEAHRGEQPWDTAFRETNEEFGELPNGMELICSLRFPLLIFDWTTFVVRLPEGSGLPDRTARDFSNEFRDAAWFPITALPLKTHPLIHPVIIRLRTRGPRV